MNTQSAYSTYWGKTLRGEGLMSASYHLLPYHCLDAAFVTYRWWDCSKRVRDMVTCCIVPTYSPEQLRAWLLFYVALHDLGKWDIRFQLKAGETWEHMNNDWNYSEHSIETKSSIQNYDHGKMGFGVFCREMYELAEECEHWYTWMSAVTGHHGTLPDGSVDYYPPQVDERWATKDSVARKEWVAAIEKLFLKPYNLSVNSPPPDLSPEGRSIVAGLCSIADWIASQESIFSFRSEIMEIEEYWKELQEKLGNSDIIGNCGISKEFVSYGGVAALLPKEHEPRQVQCLVSKLSTDNGLTIVEAPTGSGKTEAGIALAWKILAAGKAESIVFALPTQATANAMFDRVLAFAEQLFLNGGGNYVLAHGKSLKNHQFQQLCAIGRNGSAIGREDGKTQCAEWLSSSKKRVFLGQVGICTIDQILISVLPVRHSFVRMFGLGRSVLLVDEVHAYDAYMYTLLGEVLERHASVGGSAILLSATLPSRQKEKLIKAWGGSLPWAINTYPLVTQVARNCDATSYELPPDQLPAKRVVKVQLHKGIQEEPLEKLFERVIAVAQKGARIGLIFNTVDAAQKVAMALRCKTELPVDLFHSRYMFCDRQQIEIEILKNFGPGADRKKGRILVATQVVEQSLDLDFDWMITELCPIDLLFQRIGRLHRHFILHRPSGFEFPQVDVLVPEEANFGVTGLIYGNLQILWRTQKMLEQCGETIIFPEAFRNWVETVYQEQSWGEEPVEILKAHEKFLEAQAAREYKAKQLIEQYMNPLADTDEHVAALTRDGEMQVSVLLQHENGGLLSGETGQTGLNSDAVDEAVVSVPGTKSWRSSLPAMDHHLGMHVLRMKLLNEGTWEAVNAMRQKITYSRYSGLRREEN